MLLKSLIVAGTFGTGSKEYWPANTPVCGVGQKVIVGMMYFQYFRATGQTPVTRPIVFTAWVRTHLVNQENYRGSCTSSAVNVIGWGSFVAVANHAAASVPVGSIGRCVAEVVR